MGIGGRMKEIRKEKGLKQVDVARDLMISQSYISGVECGKEMPNARFVKLFCLQYGISERELMNEDNPTEMQDSSMEQLSIDCIAQHLMIFHEQSVEGRIADFGEPCSTCPYAMKECRLEWLTRMKPLFDRSNIQIRLDYPELPQQSNPLLEYGTDVSILANAISQGIQAYLSKLNK